MEPKIAVEEYIESRKYEGAAKSTLNNYSYRLKRFTEFCALEDLDGMEMVSGRTVEMFKKYRVEEGDVNSVTLEQQLRTLHHFLNWCEANELVDDGLADRMLIPNATPEQRVRHNALAAERAEEILEHLQKFEYASRRHIIFHILWHTGMRTGGLRALDVDDFEKVVEELPANADADQRVSYVLKLRHRPESDTPLKLKQDGERNITVADDNLAESIEDWIENKRPDVEDGYGREPLIATKAGRAAHNTIRTDVYTVVQPCRYTNGCPHNRELNDCENRKHGKRAGCPSSIYPHAIRSGAITEHLNKDVPKEIVSERANVSQEILDEHYDERTLEEKRERRLKYL